jgi:hypothetical protein
MIEMHLKKGKIFSTLVIMTLIIAVVTNIFFIGPIVTIVRAADQSDSYYNDTTLNVTVLQLEPRVNWYDLQNATGVSFLNAQLDVNTEYYFLVNVSSDQGWENIKYINISCWHDLGSDAGTYNYNGTLGGNINMKLQYDNVSDGTGQFYMLWPNTNSEATLGSCSEANTTPATDPAGSHTYNLTFAWTPGYQFRYAPDATDTAEGFNDTWSWNFNLTVVDDDGYYNYNNPTKTPDENEFSVYSYTEIVSAGWPVVVGNPNQNASVNDAGGSGNISIQQRSNGNYSLAVNVTNLTHKITGSDWIDNTSIWTRGGTDDFSSYFDGANPLYYYGSAATYNASEGNFTSKTTSDIEWGVNIPLAQLPGDYNATIYYHLRTQT